MSKVLAPILCVTYGTFMADAILQIWQGDGDNCGSCNAVQIEERPPSCERLSNSVLTLEYAAGIV